MENQINGKKYRYIRFNEDFELPEFGIGYHLWAEQGAEEHYHDYYEFFVITKNSILHRCNGQDKILYIGTLRFIRPNDIHGFFLHKKIKSQHINIAATPDTTNQLIEALSANLLKPVIYSDREIEISLNETELNFFIYLSQQISLCEASNREAKAVLAKAMLTHALCIVISRTNGKSRSMPDWFSALLEKINSVEMLTSKIDDIYKLSNYSHAMLIHYFKKYTGDTIIAYFTKVKINYACNLLEKTNFTTLAIAGKIGFDSLSHFNRIFKKLTGKTPKEYQKSVVLQK